MSNRIWLVLVLVGLTVPCHAGKIDPFEGSRPVAVLVQENPWVKVVGAETPRIAIYENGDVIYSRDLFDQKREAHFLARLDPNALSGIQDHLRTVTGIADLQSNYSLSDSPNLGSALFYLHVDNRDVVICVYGMHLSGADSSYIQTGRIPDPLRKFYDYLWTLQFAESRPWHSPYVEAMAWPYPEATEPSIVWPKDWPDLKSDRALPRGENYSIFLNSDLQGALQKFLADEKPKGAVEIDGKKWSVAWRTVFPSEPIWRKAFSSLGNY